LPTVRPFAVGYRLYIKQYYYATSRHVVCNRIVERKRGLTNAVVTDSLQSGVGLVMMFTWCEVFKRMRSSRRRSGKPSHRKANGVHYTPPELAGFLAEVTVQALGEREGPVQVLDPACGDGGLLIAFSKAVPASLRSRLVLTSYETDPAALAEAERALATVGVGEVVLRAQDFLSVEGVASEDEYSQRGLFDPEERVGQRFDAVIANPPYVRTQVLGAKKAQELAERFRLTGRVDLYQAFTQAMANVLKPGGVLGLLTSNRFLTVKSGASLRHLLRREFALEAIYDLGDTKLFAAAVLPVVVVAKKQRAETPPPCIFDRVYERRKDAPSDKPTCTYPSILEALHDRKCDGLVKTPKGLYSLERGVLSVAGEEAWSLSTPTMDAWLQTVYASRECSFSDLAKVRVGIKTTADEVFLKDDWDRLPEDIRPEEELLRPLLTHFEANRWFADPQSRLKQVLYPHVVKDGKRLPIELDAYPRAAAYLGAQEERLRRRKYVLDSGRKWYEIWVPQNPEDWKKEKIVYPDISEHPRFLLDTTGAVVNGDCYWITLNEGVKSDWLLLMLAVANSTFITWYYDAVYHNKLYSGRRRFMTQYVSGFPLPSLDKACGKKIVQLVSCLVREGTASDTIEKQIDRLVWESFGLGKEVAG
jgi:adenine-specific DNA-methyltransferase